MRARLTIFETDRPARQVVLSEGKNYLIGRDESCSLCIADESLSRRHAKIIFQDDNWRLSDLASKNGTFVGGRPVNHYPLADNDWIEMGNVLVSFDHVSQSVLDADQHSVDQRWQTTIQASRVLTPTLKPGELLRHALKAVVEISGCERGFVMLCRKSGELVPDVSEPPDAGRFSGSQSVVRKVLEESRPVACSDISANAELMTQPSIATGGISALACLPMMVGGNAIGVVYVDSGKSGKTFMDLDIELMQAMADHAALVIGVSRLRENIVDLSALLPAELERAQPPRPSLVQKLNEFLPQLDDKQHQGVAVAGVDS